MPFDDEVLHVHGRTCALVADLEGLPVHRAAGGVALEPGHVDELDDRALTDDGGVAVYEDGDHAPARRGVAPQALLAADAPRPPPALLPRAFLPPLINPGRYGFVG
jgi:hypothetical protein